MHPDQLEVGPATVRALVAEQLPELADRAVTRVGAASTVNAVFRLGDDLAARLPLVPQDADDARTTLRAEAAATAELVGATRFPVPEPVALGEPGPGYPMPWSVQTWLPGVTAVDAAPGGSVGFAHDLAELVTGVRAIDTRGRTFGGGRGVGRGGDLRDHDDWVQQCLRDSRDLLDVRRLDALWRRLRELPREAPDVMNHGDLMPGNLLVADGRLAGVLDCGGLGAADPALDLVAAWHLLEAGPRAVLRADLGCGDLEWSRGAAWAFEQALGLVPYYATTSPVMSRLGARTLRRLLDADLP